MHFAVSFDIRAEVQMARQTSQLHSIARATSSSAGAFILAAATLMISGLLPASARPPSEKHRGFPGRREQAIVAAMAAWAEETNVDHALRSRWRRGGPAVQPVLLAYPHGARAQGPRSRDRPLAAYREGQVAKAERRAGAGHRR